MVWEAVDDNCRYQKCEEKVDDADEKDGNRGAVGGLLGGRWFGRWCEGCGAGKEEEEEEQANCL